MTHTPTLVRTKSPRDTVRRFPAGGAAGPSAAAEEACALFFARVDPVGPFGADDHAALAEAVVEIGWVRPDEPVRRWSRPSAHLHLIVHGWAYSAQILPSGARQITDILLPGDLAG